MFHRSKFTQRKDPATVPRRHTTAPTNARRLHCCRRTSGTVKLAHPLVSELTFDHAARFLAPSRWTVYWCGYPSYHTACSPHPAYEQPRIHCGVRSRSTLRFAINSPNTTQNRSARDRSCQRVGVSEARVSQLAVVLGRASRKVGQEVHCPDGLSPSLVTSRNQETFIVLALQIIPTTISELDCFIRRHCRRRHRRYRHLFCLRSATPPPSLSTSWVVGYRAGLMVFPLCSGTLHILNEQWSYAFNSESLPRPCSLPFFLGGDFITSTALPGSC